MFEVGLSQSLHQHLGLASFDLIGHQAQKKLVVGESVFYGLISTDLERTKHAAQAEFFECWNQFINGAHDWPPLMHRAAREDCEHGFEAPHRA